MKNLYVLIMLVLCVSSLYARELVYIPTAESCDGLRLSFDYDTKDKNHIFTSGIGINGFEVSFVNYHNKYAKDKFIPNNKSLISGQWQITPDFGPVPAVAIGFKDFCCKINKTPAFYGVVTKDVAPFLKTEAIDRLAFTLGVSHQSLGIFGGAELKIGYLYGSIEAYKEDINYAGGLTFLEDMIKVGYKRFNKSNYISADIGLTF